MDFAALCFDRAQFCVRKNTRESQFQICIKKRILVVDKEGLFMYNH